MGAAGGSERSEGWVSGLLKRAGTWSGCVRERGATEGSAARYTMPRRGTTARSSAPLAGVRSARQGSRHAVFGRCGATRRQRPEAVRRKARRADGRGAT